MKDLLIEKMYEWSKKPYQKYIRKNAPWTIGITELLTFREESLGFQLGKFLSQNHFEMQEKLEDHDVIHVLTNTGITVIDEIGMQFFLLGNGKRSLYLFMVIIVGIIFYPTQFSNFLSYYKRGKNSHIFYNLDFLKMLHIPVPQIKYIFNIQ